jgi:predicted lysophospholipase L1 biosynthesis ABC-type transport system permease subunit
MQLTTAIEREVKGLVPTWPSFQFRTLDEGLQLQRRLPRVAESLLGGLGVFALFLAAIGLYGVMSYVVKQRTREIGIRLALGAPNASVLRLVIRQGMAVCSIGAAVGRCDIVGQIYGIEHAHAARLGKQNLWLRPAGRGGKVC